MSFWTAVATFFKDAKIAWDAASTLKKISYVFQAVTAVVGVKGFMQAKQMMAKGQDILANKTAAGGKLPVIYGTRRVGAQIIYMDVSANDSRDLYVVYALSVGECDEILGRTIELDGNPLTDSARFRDGGYIGSDKISSGNYSLNTVSQNGTGINAGAGQFGSSPTSKYRYVMNLHHGQATQIADPMLVASMPNWTTAHKLNGVAYIAAHYGYDKEGIWSGVPQLTVQVRGKKVFDPRDSGQTFGDVSTYKYSDNPALCFLNYITDNEVGKGLTQSQINMSTFTAAANVCDTKVDQPYFNGTAQSLTWSGNIGDDFITIGGTDPNTNWWQNKVGEIIDVRDGSNTLVVDGKEIKDVQRNGFYDQNNEYIVYINDTLGSTYSSQAGTSLVKVKRFHCNGYLDANKNVMDNAKELLANMRGIFLYIDGKYELSIEDTGTATFNITDDHIISDAGISVDYGNKDKKANKVIVEFFNANKKYELDTATVLHDATPEYYSDDGNEILEIKAEFPYVTDPYIAYNMAKAILVRSRKQMTIQFLGTPEMYKLNVGDIVTLSYAGTFDTVQTCRVEALELQSNGLVSVSLIEYFDVYTWETPPEEPLEELANLPSAYAVKAPTGLSFTDSNASSTDRPFLSWNTPTDFPDAQYRVNVVDGSGNQVINRIVDVENCDLNFVPTGSYVASVTSLNTLGTESSPARFPTTGTFTVGDAPVGLGDVQADVITANEINVTSLSAISADLGSITAGNMNIGSGNFTVSTAGLMTATDATISGGITATSLNVTNATITGTLDASVITLNNEPLSNVLTYSEVGGIGLLSFNEGAAIDGDFVVAGNFEATGSQPDLIVGKVTGISSDTVQANAILRSLTGSGSFKIQGGQSNTTVVSLAYDALGGTTLSADGGAVGTFKINADGALALTFDSSQNATFTGEVTADALGLPSQTPSTTTNKLYNVGGSLYFNGSAVGGGGTGDITAVTAGTNLNGGGTSGAVTLNLDNTISITGTISSGSITVDKANGTGAVVGMQLLSGSSQGDSIAINFGSTTANEYSLLYDHYTNRLNLTDGGSNVFYVAGGVVNFSSAPVFGGGLTVPSLSVTGNGTIQTGAAGLIKGGYYQVGSTTVIDTSRNLTNIGTISSGAITATTTSGSALSVNSGTTNVVAKFESSDATAWINLKDSASGTYGTLLGAEGGLFRLRTNSNDASTDLTVDTNGNLGVSGNINLSSTTATTPAITFNTSSGTDTSVDMAIRATGEGLDFYEPEDGEKLHMRIIDDDGVNATYGFRTGAGNGTLRINAAGNLINIGAISSGAITATGAINSTGTGGAIQVNGTTRINSVGDIIATSYYIGGTNIIDTSRNLTNIGTISSGAITSSGKVIATQLDLVGADVYIAYGSAGTAPGNGDYLRLRDVATGNDALQFYMDSVKLFSIDGQTGNAYHKGTISSGATTTTSDTFNKIYSITDQANAGIEFSSHSPSRGQKGNIFFQHGNSLSYGAGAAFTINSTETLTVLADGRLMFKDGLYVKPSSGTGAGTQIIDSSRNLLNIGTISSGAITGSGNLSVAGTINSGVIAPSSYFDMSAAGSYFKGNSAHGYRFNNQADTLNLVTIFDNGNVRLHQGSLQIGTTTVIDSSRNFFNIGTISSGAITSTVVNTGDATLLTLYHDTGVDTAQQKSFIDFSFQDDNTNETPQVRIGAEVGQNGNADTQIKEGSGAFVVYTNNATTTSGAATGLDERFRVDYRGYVGINNTTPSSLLDVNGTVTFKAAGNGWTDNLNLMSSDGTNKWNLLVDNGFADGLRFGYNQNARVEFSTAGVVTATGFTTPGSISGGFTRAYVAGTNNVQTIVAVIGSDSKRPVLQFSESTVNTITAGMSLEYNGVGSGATNYMSINAVTGASIFKVYSGGNVQLTGAAKLLFNNTSNFGVGAGGHNYNSVYVDTLESGSANDMLELVYYQGAGVRIGQSGNEKPLICGAFTSEAITTDGNFVMTKDQPWVVIENTAEDGGGIVFNDNQAGAWPAASSQQFRMTYHSGNNSFVMGHDENSYTGFSFASGGNFTANGNVTAYSDERLKTNIQTLDSKKALQMRGVSFIKDGVEGSGVIAQEIEEIAPELVITADDEMGTKSVAYGNLVGYLIETVKDQQKQIDELKQRLDNDS